MRRFRMTETDEMFAALIGWATAVVGILGAIAITVWKIWFQP